MWRGFAMVLIYLSWGSPSASAQLRLYLERTQQDPVVAGISYRFVEHADFTDSALKSVYSETWLPFSDPSMPLSDPTRTCWIRIPLSKLAAGQEIRLLNIDNPHLNLLKVWIRHADGHLTSFPMTGDNLPFHTRMFPETGFVYALPLVVLPGDTLYVAADKRASKLELPVHFTSRSYHIRIQQRRMLGYGVFFGFMILLLMMNAWLYATTRARVYLWYGVYLLTILGYLASDSGLLFQYIFPSLPGWNDLLRPFLFGASLFPLLLFFNELLEIRQRFPIIHRFNRWLLTIYLSLFVIALFMSSSGVLIVQSWWLKVSAVLVPVFYLIILGETLYCVSRRIRFAFFMLLSFGSYSILVSIFLLAQRDMIVQNTFTLKAHYIALLLDAGVVASSLFWRFRHLSAEAGRLQRALLKQQARIFSETAEWQKTEMRRFSSLLHDSIGAHLGLLRLKADQMTLTDQARRDLSQRIGGLADEVRRMSHRFSPLVLQEKGLKEALAEEVRFLRSETGIIFQYEWLGDHSRLPHSYEIIIYRMVQELLQNVFKHAGASEVILQVISDGRQLSMYVEDNGRGASVQDGHTAGIGLRSIRELTEFLGGRCRIRTSAGEGFSVSIELNIHDYADHKGGDRG
jgi:signal transduction histidine kinase